MDYAVPRRGKANFFAIGLSGADTHFFMEFCPTEPARRNSYRTERAFNDRYASLNRAEEALEMLQQINFAVYEKSHADQSSTLTALIARIEQSVPLALPAHLSSDAQIRSSKSQLRGNREPSGLFSPPLETRLYHPRGCPVTLNPHVSPAQRHITQAGCLPAV